MRGQLTAAGWRRVCGMRGGVWAVSRQAEPATARIAGLAYSEMIDELGRRGIATIRLAPGELERELAAFGG